MTIAWTQLTNKAYTTLATAITGASVSSFTVSNASAFPSSGTFLVTIDNEIVQCSGRSGVTFYVNSGGRGYESTTASSHASGTNVELRLTAGIIKELQDNISTIEGQVAALSSISGYSVGRSATLYVASTGASTIDIAQADYKCGASANVTLQIALNEAKTLGGARIVLSRGDFPMYSGVSVPANTTIEGQGNSTRIIVMATGVSPFQLDTTTSRCIHIKNISFEGNSKDNTTSPIYAIYFYQSTAMPQDPDHRFDNLYIENMNGIWLGPTGAGLGACIINKVIVLGGSSACFYIGTQENKLSYCEAGKRSYNTTTPTRGYILYGSKNVMSFCDAYKCQFGGIAYNEGNIIRNGRFELCDYSGFYLTSAYQTIFEGNAFRANGASGVTGTWADLGMAYSTSIAKDVSGNIISNNYFGGDSYNKYHIDEIITNCDYNLYVGNIWGGGTSGTIVIQGAHSTAIACLTLP